MAPAAETASAPPGRWIAVVPLRGLTCGKTRLRAHLPRAVVDDLVREMAETVLGELADCTAVGRVLVVTQRGVPPELTGRAHTEMLVQRGEGLGDAVAEAVSYARSLDGSAPVLVVHADLPRLTSAELDDLLRRLDALGEDAFVRDQTGAGTTLVTLEPGSGREPAFGPDSAARHAAAGFTEIAVTADSGLGHDLDTPADYTRYRSLRAAAPSPRP